MSPLDLARTFLASRRRPDGSWPYLEGGAGEPEPTTLAAAAGFADAATIAWLSTNPLGWSELLAPACLSNTPGAAPTVQKIAADILQKKAKKIDITQMSPQEFAELGHDVTIDGWSWAPATAAWVEPTSYAILSLKRAGFGADPRVTDGEALLRDRQCADGGWNYGNPMVMGQDLESDPPPTAWAALALPRGPEADRGLARLRGVLDHPSALGLSLTILAQTSRGAGADPAFVAAIVARQEADGSFAGRCDWTALAVCALAAAEGVPHVFAV